MNQGSINCLKTKIYNFTEILFSGSNKGEIVVWDITEDTNKILHKVIHEGDIRCIMTRENFFFSAINQGPIRRWVFTPENKLELIGQSRNDFYTYYGQAFDISSGGVYLFGASKDKEKYVLVEDMYAPKCKTLKGHSDTVMAIRFSKKYKRLYTASYDKSVIAWDIRGMSEVYKAKSLHKDQIYSMELSKKERHIFTGGRDKKIKIMLASTLQILTTLVFPGQIYCVKLSKQNSNLLISGWNRSCFEIWNTEYLCFEDIAISLKEKQSEMFEEDFLNDQTMCGDSMIQQFVIRESNFSQNLDFNVSGKVEGRPIFLSGNTSQRPTFNSATSNSFQNFGKKNDFDLNFVNEIGKNNSVQSNSQNVPYFNFYIFKTEKFV